MFPTQESFMLIPHDFYVKWTNAKERYQSQHLLSVRLVWVEENHCHALCAHVHRTIQIWFDGLSDRPFIRWLKNDIFREVLNNMLRQLLILFYNGSLLWWNENELPFFSRFFFVRKNEGVWTNIKRLQKLTPQLEVQGGCCFLSLLDCEINISDFFSTLFIWHLNTKSIN